MESKKLRPRKLRLKGYDYSQGGSYFITICSHYKQSLFGEVRNYKMVDNALGSLIRRSWENAASQHPFADFGTWVLMPNHMHAMVSISDDNVRKKSLSRIVAAFKAQSTARARQCFDPAMKIWQPGYYERIVRTNDALEKIIEYIETNPLKWDLDPYNPDGGARSDREPIEDLWTPHGWQFF